MVFTFDGLEGAATNSSFSTKEESWNPLDSPVVEKPVAPFRTWAQMAGAGTRTTTGKDVKALSEKLSQLNIPSRAPMKLQEAVRQFPARKPPQPVKGGLSAIFASESRDASRAGSRAGSDVEGAVKPQDVGGKKKRAKTKKAATGGPHNLLARDKQKQNGSQNNLRATSTTTVNPSNVAALLPVPSKNPGGGLEFNKLPVSAYSQPTSSASSDIEDSEVPTSLSVSVTSSLGTTPVRKGMLAELLEKHNASVRDLITITSDDGKNVETYEVALEHDFISGDVRSRPVTRSGSRDRMMGAMRELSPSSRAASRPSTPSPLGARPCIPSANLQASLAADMPTKPRVCAADFEVLRCLGKGAYGTVLLVRHLKTGKLYAQKQLKKAFIITTKKLVEQTLTERQILEAVRHPFVVKLYYAFQDHQKLYLILEYAQGGELFMHLAHERMFTEETAAFYMASLVLALSHLHKNAGVVYRDLKPENCLLDAEGYLLLTDFGLSKVATDESVCRSWVGTVEYMAPEIIKGDEYDEKVDWWSLGALGMDLLTGNAPFTGPNRAKIQEKIVKSKVVFPYFMSQDAKDLLGKLLQKNPQKRWGVADVEKMKKHRFFRRIDWKKLEARCVDGGPPIKPLVTDPEMAENFSVQFTSLACSPPVHTGGMEIAKGGFGAVGMVEVKRDGEESEEMFGGFSFVGSYGLAVEREHWAERRGW